MENDIKENTSGAAKIRVVSKELLMTIKREIKPLRPKDDPRLGRAGENNEGASAMNLGKKSTREEFERALAQCRPEDFDGHPEFQRLTPEERLDGLFQAATLVREFKGKAHEAGES